MVHPPALAAVAVVFMMFVSGCIGGDEPVTVEAQDAESAAAAAPTEATGSIQGKIVSDSIEEIEGVIVLALAGDVVAYDTQTDRSGMFTINDVTPGRYVIQLTRVGYDDKALRVTVEANTVTEVNEQLRQLSDRERGVPLRVDGEFTGFLSCGVGVHIPDVHRVSYALCSFGAGAAGQSVTADPNDKFMDTLIVEPGLKEIVVGMTWDPVGGLSGEELILTLENKGCNGACTGVRYARTEGPPDLLLGSKYEDVEGTKIGFENITEDGRELQIRVFVRATPPASFVYQQPFHVYWTAFYNQYAPEDHNPIPEE